MVSRRVTRSYRSSVSPQHTIPPSAAGSGFGPIGSLRIRRITIEPSLIAANDKPMLEDLIVVAVNDALARAQQLMQEAMGKLGPMGGLKIPGFGGD